MAGAVVRDGIRPDRGLGLTGASPLPAAEVEGHVGRLPAELTLSQACAGTKAQRLAAGRVMLASLGPGKTLMRRVERISWVSPHEFDRRVSVVVNSSAATDKAAAEGLVLDIQFLGLLPKGLLRDFDVRGPSGESRVLMDRQLDSRAARSFMVALAEKHVKAEIPRERVWRRLFLAAYRFPDHRVPPMQPGRLEAWAKSLGREDLSAHKVKDLEAQDLAWWDAACEHPGWAWWLRRIVVNFAMFVHEPPSSGPQVFKYRWHELNPHANLGPRKQRAQARERGGFGYRIPLYDFGRAASEHAHVVAAPETFLTGGVLTRGAGRVNVRSRATLRQQTFYLGPRDPSRSPGLCHIHLRVLPAPRALLEPMRLLAWYTALLLIALFFLQAIFNVAEHITKSADAVVALVVFAPSLMFPLLLLRDEHELRWRLLKGWRELVFVLLLPVPLAFVLLVALPTGGAGRWVLSAVLAVIAGYTSFLGMRLVEDARTIMKAHNIVEGAERLPVKGQRNEPSRRAA